MKCYFPIPSHSTNNSRVIYAPQSHKIHQADTIHQLRLQNELLKQQLSALTKNKDQQPTLNRDINIQNKYLQKVAMNSEQEVQQKYKNKMLKLKSGRSRSKNTNHYETTPNSPKKQEGCRQEINIAQRIPFVPLPLRNQQNLKVMIVQRDNNGRFFRDRQSEQKVKTVRMKSPQVFPIQKDFYSPKFTQTQNFPPQFVTHLPKQKGHQRSETAPIEETNGQLTKRFSSRYSTVETDQNLCEFSRQILESRRKSIESNIIPNFKKMQFSNQMKLDLNAKCAESIQIIKPKVVSPRGAAYIQKIEASKPNNTKIQTQQDESRNESLMSIEKGLDEIKRKRKLRYDIYLADQKDN